MRTAEFDKEFVLRQAMAMFMLHGYAKTSMQKLTQATHLHPGSLYGAFGNKKVFFSRYGAIPNRSQYTIYGAV